MPEPASETRPDRSGDDTIQRALHSIREHLGMEVGYLSEFVGEETVFRHVDAPGLEHLAKPGDRRSLDDVYCRHILEGRLPSVIPDTAAEPLAASMPITAAVPIGAHMSLPIRLRDGRVYGMFCCLSPTPNPSLNARDLATMQLFAEVVTGQVEKDLARSADRRRKERRIRGVLDDGRLFPVYQPIFDLKSRRPIGYEALSRFESVQPLTPDLWFNDAFEVGLGLELELAAIERALMAVQDLTEDQYLSFNASPATVLDPAFQEAIEGYPLDRLVLEITEHAPIDDYEALEAAMWPLRCRGLRIAIDDAGAGHASMRHIVQLRPDIVKIDMSLTRNVDTDLARRALIGALNFYSEETAASIVAEGIETEGEYNALRRLRIGRGQGYYLARPDRTFLKDRARLSA